MIHFNDTILTYKSSTYILHATYLQALFITATAGNGSAVGPTTTAAAAIQMVSAMSGMTGTRFEFLFTSLVKSTPVLFTAAQTVLKAYRTSGLYRDVKLRGSLVNVDTKQLELLPNEILYTKVRSADTTIRKYSIYVYVCMRCISLKYLSYVISPL